MSGFKIPDLPVGKKWVCEGGVIYIPNMPASEGVSGPEWFLRLQSKGFQVTPDGQNLLTSNGFKPTRGVTYRLAVLPATFWKDDRRYTRFIREEGRDRRWNELELESMCILREYLSDEELVELGLAWIVGIHEPVQISFDPHLAGIERRGTGRWFNASPASPGVAWRRFGAFAWSL